MTRLGRVARLLSWTVALLIPSCAATRLGGLTEPALRGFQTPAARDANDDNHRERSLAIYALYNVPPFAVTFQTEHTAELESALLALHNGTSTNSQGKGVVISETNGVDSSLSFPIRSITQEFLLERLATKVTELSQTQDAVDPEDDGSPYQWFPIYHQLVEIDLRAIMYLVDGTPLEDEQNSRRTLSQQPAQRSLVSHVTLMTELYGSVVFEEPTDASTKPSNNQVRTLFGLWIDEIFSDHRDQYLRELVQSDQDLLRKISSLHIATNIDVASPLSPSYTTAGWSERTEKALLSLLILTGAIGLAWMGLYLHQRRKHRIKARDFMEEQDYELDRPPALNRGHRSSSMDAARHGTSVFYNNTVSGAVSILESTDRYLFKHRPDLYDRSTANGSNATANSNGSTTTLSMFGRDYAIPANPFEYIYSSFSSPMGEQNSSLSTSPQGAFTPRGATSSLVSPVYARRSSLEVQRQNIAASHFNDIDDGDVPDDERADTRSQPVPNSAFTGVGHWAERGGYRPISSIWRNITNMWDYDPTLARPQSANDGLVVASPHPHVGENGMEMQTIPLEPYRDDYDEADYDFAFKDFPRHDGTPCLIFNEDALQNFGGKKKEFEISFPNGDGDDIGSISENMSSSPFDETAPLSDEAFQRMLAQHNHFNPSGNTSCDDSIFSNEQVGNDSSDSINVGSVLTEAKSPAFRDKLGRLMQQKHRQYEKKAIVEKHQEKRAKERKHLREQERRERHKDMERQIEDMEAAFLGPLAGGPTATGNGRNNGQPHSPKPTASRWAAGQYSPNPNLSRYSPKPTSQFSPSYRQGYSPYRKTAGAGAASPYRTSSSNVPVIARASPVRGKSANSAGFDEVSGSFRSNTNYLGGGIQPCSSMGSRKSSSSNENSVSEPFRMRPRTTDPAALQTSSSDFLYETTESHRQGHGSFSQLSEPNMDYNTLDKLSLPQMTIDGSTGNGKYPSPSSVIDELLGAPTSISRKKTGMSSYSQQQSMPQQPYRPQQSGQSIPHRRVNSFDPAAVPSMESRPVPQQRRRFPNQRSMTPTPDTRYAPGSASTPTRAMRRGSGQHRPTTPTRSVVSTRSGSTSRAHSRSNSYSSEDIFTHGIVAQTRFV